MLLGSLVCLSVSECFAGGAAVRHAALCWRTEETGGRVEPLSHTGETTSGAHRERGQPSPGERRKQRGVHHQHGTGTAVASTQLTHCPYYISRWQHMPKNGFACIHALTTNINQDTYLTIFTLYHSLYLTIKLPSQNKETFWLSKNR